MSETTTNSGGSPPRSRKQPILLGILLIVLVGGLVLLINTITGCREHMRYHCGRQIAHIGMACRHFAQENDGQFPAKWSDLSKVKADDAWQPWFCCPASGHAVGEWLQVDLWADYRLIAGRTTNDPPDTILAIESLSNHKSGAHVLFVDGSSTWLTREQVLGQKPMPKWMTE